MFSNKVAVVTGAARGIGRAIAEAFRGQGACVATIDRQEDPYFTGDLGNPTDIRSFAGRVIADYGRVDFLINNAPPLFQGIDTCSLTEFENALRVGASAPFYLTQLFLPYLGPTASIVNISSTRQFMSQPQSESYAAAKGALGALTHALAASLAGRARVNAISPGWIDTSGRDFAGADSAQHPAGRVGRPEDIAQMALYLCSEKASFITGQNIIIDGGMTRQMIYHGDGGWKLES